MRVNNASFIETSLQSSNRLREFFLFAEYSLLNEFSNTRLKILFAQLILNIYNLQAIVIKALLLFQVQTNMFCS